MELQKTEKKAWWVVEFDVESKHEEMASWLMIHIGANGCQWISSSSDLVTLQASFEQDRISPTELGPLYAALDEYGLAAVIPTVRINKLEEEDWLLEWKKGIAPLPMGDCFIICPPWLLDGLSEEERDKRIVLIIEPGMAFGTGFHFTTQFCLRAIEKHSASARKILDVGTGSGILAIACAKLLNAEKPPVSIFACEIDPDACVVARENIELNEVEEQVKLLVGSTETVKDEKFDLILSNLTCEDNVALLPDYAGLLHSNSRVIMSGILKEKLPILEAEIARQPFEVIEIEKQETWAGVVIARK